MYDQFYHLKGRPFQLTPDPHFFFESATHRKALSYLGYGLAQGEGFIVITGDVGAGKTTLVGHVMSTIDPARLTAVKIVSTQVGGDDMLRLIAQSFGLVDEALPKAMLLQRIEAFLHGQARKGLRTLLIVDEAQNLPISAIEELRMLSNFQLGGQALLQIFLLGQPEFRAMLNSPELEQLRQRVIATHHLDPMMESEIGPYVKHRLTLVDWRDDPQFAEDVFPAVYHATGGVPRRVNALMSRVLLLGAVDQVHRIDASMVEAVAADMGLETEDPGHEAPVAAPVAPVPAAPAQAAPAPSAGGEAPAFAASVVSPAAAAAQPDVAELRHIQDELEDLRREIGLTAGLGLDQKALVVRLEQAEQRLVLAETRGEEQEAVLRRILTLLVDWVEQDEKGTRAA